MLDDSRLLLSVHDNGLGLPVLPGQPPSGSGSGFGLQQIRERLASRYGGAARFDLTADSAGGTRACIVLPLKSQP
jgi:signal transduction histidine kinase